MKGLNKYIVLTFAAGMLLVSCAKEEVKPFHCGNGTSTPSNRTGEIVDEVINTDNGADATATGDDVSTDEQIDEGGITDGGTSSDYDTKGKKKANKQN